VSGRWIESLSSSTCQMMKVVTRQDRGRFNCLFSGESSDDYCQSVEGSLSIFLIVFSLIS
jgi:hypothetical protein